MDKAEAIAITDKLRQLTKDLSELVVRAYDGRVWEPMGYDSWDAYCKAEFNSGCIKLPREERIKVVVALKERKVSGRSISSSLGISHTQVQRDLKSNGTNVPLPDHVNCSDGRSYPATKPRGVPKVTEEDLATAHQQIIAQGGQVLPLDSAKIGPSPPTPDMVATHEEIRYC